MSLQIINRNSRNGSVLAGNVLLCCINCFFVNLQTNIAQFIFMQVKIQLLQKHTGMSFL